MCGIMGWSFNQNCTLTMRQRATILEHAAFGADKRGGQSWGILTVDKARPSVSRGLGALVRRNFRKLAQHPFGFAHSRFATKGAVSVENCHPYDIGGVIGAHNGVLSNSFELDKKFGDESVDSRHIFKAIDAGRSLEDLEGYGVIEFYLRKFANSIMLADIGRGSVTLFELGRHQGYIWTSLKEDGELALESVGADRGATIINIHEGKVYAIVPDTEVYVTDMPEMKLGKSYTYTSGYEPQLGFHSDHSWRGRSTYNAISDKWRDETGEFPSLVEASLGMTKEEKAELREEMVASWQEEQEDKKAEAAASAQAAGQYTVEKEWQIGEKFAADEEKEDTKPGVEPPKLIVAC